MNNAALDFLGDAFNREYNKKDTIKRIPGVIKTIVPDSSYGKAVVTVGSRDITLLNKTGEVLYEGDHVWVHYWNSLMDGYIALRNGRAENLGGFHIDSAAVIPNEMSSLYAVSDEVINIDTENKMKSYYGDIRNVIIVNGYPAIACSSDVSSSIDGGRFFTDSPYIQITAADKDLQDKILSLDKNLLSARIASYWVPQGTPPFNLGTEYHYYVDIASIQNIGGEWCYYLGMYCEEVPSFSWTSSIYFKDPNILSSAGIIQAFSYIRHPQEWSSSEANGFIEGFPILCCGDAESGYYAYGTTSSNVTVVRAGGLLIAQKGYNTAAFGNISEYHYAVNLTSKSEIISSRR